jgi:hypothetical protein
MREIRRFEIVGGGVVEGVVNAIARWVYSFV